MKKLNKIICFLRGHLWMYGYTNNPNGGTDIDNPGTWYGPVERLCERCLKTETKW